MAWLLSNWQGVIAILSMILGVVVAIAHQVHADGVAQTISDIQSDLDKIAGSKPPGA